MRKGSEMGDEAREVNGVGGLGGGQIFQGSVSSVRVLTLSEIGGIGSFVQWSTTV